MTDETQTLNLQLPIRLRRNRKAEWSRKLVREHRLSVDDLIFPLFVTEDRGRTQIASMPGIERYDLKEAVKAARQAADLGIPALALFPHIHPALKDEIGSEALNAKNLLCRTVRAIKSAVPQIGIITDIALDPYTSHGHDGLFREGGILNDETVHLLIEQALVQAEAGADIVAPSDMMDGRIGAIRRGLDEAGFTQVQILSYAAKYASSFYGPFREAVGSGSVLQGDKKSYQMDPANGNEALREALLDIEEGADIVMVKPGLPYLDIIYRVKERFGLPTFAYQVSGEYAMLEAAAAQGWLDRDRAFLESLMAFKRAGADAIMTYFALSAARLLAEKT